MMLCFSKRMFTFVLRNAGIFTWLKERKSRRSVRRGGNINFSSSRPERLGVLQPGPSPLPCFPPSRSGPGGATWAARRSAGCTGPSWTAAASRELAGMGCRRAQRKKKTCQLNKEGGRLILDALIKVECAECEHCDMPDLVINLQWNYKYV